MVTNAINDILFRIKEINKKFNTYNQKIFLAQRNNIQRLKNKYSVTNNEESKKSEINFKSKFKKEVEKIQNKNLLKKEHINKIIKKASIKYDIPESLIHSMIKIESQFNPRAVSPAGAKGLMQLMSNTAKYLGVKNIYDPEENIMGGVKYMRELLNYFNGDLKLSLASYNSGLGRVIKSNGIPNIKETHQYIKNVLKHYKK